MAGNDSRKETDAGRARATIAMVEVEQLRGRTMLYTICYNGRCFIPAYRIQYSSGPRHCYNLLSHAPMTPLSRNPYSSDINLIDKCNGGLRRWWSTIAPTRLEWQLAAALVLARVGSPMPVSQSLAMSPSRQGWIDRRLSNKVSCLLCTLTPHCMEHNRLFPCRHLSISTKTKV